VTGLAGCGGSKRHEVAATPTSSSPTASATPTPTTAPVRCPLTGTPPQAGQDPHRAPLAVKIDNIDQARPQSGLDQADVVVEELVEGGLTRLFAVFQCSSAPTVGPIRSARTSDADLLALLHGSVFAYSGANPRAIPPIRAHGDAVLLSNDEVPQYFHRDYARPAPHNVFSSTQRLLAAGLSRRSGLDAPPALFTYDETAPTSGATAAQRVTMSWPEASAGWTWNGSTWLRTQNGTPDVLTGGHRVSAANVVILQIRLAASGIRDVAGNASPVDVTTGSGTAWVFRDGQVVRGTWHRASRSAPLRLLDASGAALPLHPGRTWIELLPRPRTPRIG
jgi:hypothetical protein